MRLTAVTLDCPDPMALATFYQQATGLELHPKYRWRVLTDPAGHPFCLERSRQSEPD
jgi:hypothetical protein